MKPTSAHPASTGGSAHHAGHRDPSEMHNDDVDHEHGDINIRAVVGFAVGLAAVTAVVFVLMVLTFNGLERNAASNDPQVSPLAAQPGRMPPEPRLLTNEPENLRKMQSVEAEQLQGYGWINQGIGIARIPIDEAKKKILERGLPSRADAPTDQRLGTGAPSMGESSAGRVLGSRATPNTATTPATPPAADPARKIH